VGEGEVEHAPDGLCSAPKQLITYCEARDILWTNIHLAHASNGAKESAADGRGRQPGESVLLGVWHKF